MKRASKELIKEFRRIDKIAWNNPNKKQKLTKLATELGFIVKNNIVRNK